jgi:heterodisulfide reductase subunit B
MDDTMLKDGVGWWRVKLVMKKRILSVMLRKAAECVVAVCPVVSLAY